MRDARTFMKHYLEAVERKGHIEYRMMLHVHGLEKGMCVQDPRPFGQAKVLDLLKCIGRAKATSEMGTPYNMSVGIVRAWLAFFEAHGWSQDPAYQKCLEMFRTFTDEPSMAAGYWVVERRDIDAGRLGDFRQLLESRHSARIFENKPLAEEDVLSSIELAARTPTACNRQMCKIYWAKGDREKRAVEKVRLGTVGFSLESVSYFVVTYDIAGLSFFGERNQGYFNAGLVAMNFINALHYMGIGSCFLQWAGKAHAIEVELKKALGIPESEQVVIFIGAGYYAEHAVIPISCRKAVQEIYTSVDRDNASIPYRAAK